MGGGLPGYLFCVLGRKAWVTPRAVGGCDGDGASRREAHRLGAVSRDFQHFHGPGRGWRALALRWKEGCCYSDVDRASGATGGVGGGALSRLRRRPPLVRVAMPVVSQCPLKRCLTLWRGAALGSHLAAWVALERSYCTLSFF